MTDLPNHMEDHIFHICNDTFQSLSDLKQHIMTHVKTIDQISNIFAQDNIFSNDFKDDYSLEERVKQENYFVYNNDNKETSFETFKNHTINPPKEKQNNGPLSGDELKSIVKDIVDNKNAIKANDVALGDQDSIEEDAYVHSLPTESIANKDNFTTTFTTLSKTDREINNCVLNETLPGYTVERTTTLQSCTEDGIANLQTASGTGNFHQSCCKTAHSCTICYKKFTRKDSLKRHLLTHGNSKSYRCDRCSCHFNRRDYLQKHMRRVHLKPTSITNDLKTNEYICSVCNKQFKWKHNLIQHKMIHSENNPNVCKICGAKFARSSHLKEHTLVHNKDRSHVCLFCDTTFTRAKYLNAHMRKRHIDISSCNSCNLKFEDVKSLSIHFKIHTEAEKDTINIAHSKKEEKGTFSNTENIDQHNMNTCNSKKPTSFVKDLKLNEYICSVCNKQFKSKNGLIQHKMIHSDNNPNVCNVCGAKFSRSSHLKDHSHIHTEDMPHVCPFCDSKFTRSSDLTVHMRRRHSDISSCNSCGLRFEDVKSLSIHLKKHTIAEIDPINIAPAKNKHYACKICGKELTTLLRLKTHLHIHSGEKKYTCEICGKEVTTLLWLKAHLLSHGGEKRYICEICGNRYRYKHGLLEHKTLHETKDRWHCDHCNKFFRSRNHIRNHIRVTHLGKGGTHTCHICK